VAIPRYERRGSRARMTDSGAGLVPGPRDRPLRGARTRDGHGAAPPGLRLYGRCAPSSRPYQASPPDTGRPRSPQRPGETRYAARASSGLFQRHEAVRTHPGRMDRGPTPVEQAPAHGSSSVANPTRPRISSRCLLIALGNPGYLPAWHRRSILSRSRSYPRTPIRAPRRSDHSRRTPVFKPRLASPVGHVRLRRLPATQRVPGA
jgi:hypothetical protein